MTSADDRFNAIAGGGLTKRRPTIAAVPEPIPDITAAAPTVDRSTVSEDKPSSSTKRRTGERFTPHSSETGGTRRVAFRVPEATDTKLRARVRADDTSKVHVILDAIEHVVAAGIELSFAAAATPADTSSLFVRPRTPSTATPTVQTDIVLDAGSLAIVDKLVKDYGAPTRTAFVMACLDAHL